MKKVREAAPRGRLSKECQQARELAGEAIDGALAADKMALLERHIPRCADCRHVYSGMIGVEKGLAELDRELATTPLPADFEGKVMGAVAATAAGGNGRFDAASNRIIMRHVYATMGIGLVPLPLVDLVSIYGAQLNMLRSLARLYEVDFTADLSRKLVASLLGSMLPFGVAAPLASLAKIIPVVGTLAGTLSLSVSGGASTYALGMVFVRHFEDGGTLANFNHSKMRPYYRSQLEKGRRVARTAKKVMAQGSSR